MCIADEQPPDELPYHPTHTELQDWDDPPTAILWPKFTSAIQDAKSGRFPELETREAKEVAVEVHEDVMRRWTERLGRWRGQVGFVTVDGFLMYWDQVGHLSGIGGCIHPLLRDADPDTDVCVAAYSARR
jgi:hypothetical protein